MSEANPDAAWIGAALTAARPQAMAALLRYFRDLDPAEEAFQEASLRALRAWPRNGPPRDPAAWLILVGRNAGLDRARRAAREAPLPDEAALSDLDDAEAGLAERLDGADYRDDILRLLFVCCHPDLPATQQIALALRIVSGLPLPRIARAFLVTEAAMEQRITRAKARIARAQAGPEAVPFGAPGPAERAERLGAVAAMIYLVFNAGYSAGSDPERTDLCGEAIRLGRLLLRLFGSEPETMGLCALMLLQHARAPARFDGHGEIVLLDDQDRRLWNAGMIAEGLALIDKAMRHKRPGPYQIQAAIAALHARAVRPQDTDWAGIDALYAALERIQPSPVVSLNRAVAVGKLRGPAEGLAMVEPLAAHLGTYFHFHGLRGAFLMQLGRAPEAREAMDRAIALAGSPAEAAHIRGQLDRLAREAQVAVKPDAAPACFFCNPLSAGPIAGRPRDRPARGRRRRRSKARTGRMSTTDTRPASVPTKGGLVAYLTVDGAMKAGAFYARAFGAETAAVMPLDEQGRTMHLHLYVNGSSLMLADAFPDHGHPYVPAQGFNLTLMVDDIGAWWERALAAGATPLLPPAEMFWGDTYAQVKDPFGVIWAMNQAKR